MDIQALITATQYEHSRQVARISGLLAEKAGYPPDEVSIITQAAALHDIGKAAVPKHILNKPGALTPEEYEIIKTHTQIGYDQITGAIRVLSAAAVVCKEHHERLDGSRGYIGLTGENIHPYARLIAVADVYDALVSRRVYKKPWDVRDICGYFREQAGKQFDGFIVGLLLGMIDDILLLYSEPKDVNHGG